MVKFLLLLAFVLVIGKYSKSTCEIKNLKALSSLINQGIDIRLATILFGIKNPLLPMQRLFRTEKATFLYFRI